MDRLEQIKNEVAREFHLKETDWRELAGEVARRYATEVARHNLERAAEQNKDLAVDAYEAITSIEIELI